MGAAKTLTLRDVQEAGGVVTDKLLDPFVEGRNDDEKDASRNNLRRSVGQYVRWLDSSDRDTRAERLDTPILDVPAAKSNSTSKKSSGSSKSKSGK